MYVDFLSWQIEYIDIWQGCIYIYIYIYVYICGLLKLVSLSKLIFGRFFLKKIKKKKLAGSIYMSVCVCGSLK